VGRVDQRTQCGAVIVWPSPRRFGDNHLPVHIHSHGPLQPIPPLKAITAVFHLLHKEGADSPRRQARCIYRDGHRIAAARTAPLVEDRRQCLPDRRLIQPPQKAVQGGVIRRVPQPQRRPQIAMFGQLDFGLSKGLVLIANQAQNGETLGVGKPGA
jgi:hypothetical protein